MPENTTCPLSENGVPRHYSRDAFAPQPFRVFADLRLDYGPWSPGRCFNPVCQRVFNPRREWQIYCCPACERAGRAEMRSWGNRMAPALLTERLGRYAPKGSQARLLSSEGRRYVGHCQTLWKQERAAAFHGGGNV